MGKSTISMAIFNSYVSHNQRVIGFVGGFQVIAPPSWLFWETWNSRSFGGFRRQVWGRLRGCFQACLGWRAAFLTNLFGLGWNQQMIWYASMNHHETLSIINDRQPSLTASFTRITPLATWKNIATAQVAIGISLWLLCGLDAATRFDPYGILRTTIWQRLNILSTLAPSIQLGW